MKRRSSNRLLRPSRLVSRAGTPGRIRTCDLRIRSPLLYPLSYRRMIPTNPFRRLLYPLLLSTLLILALFSLCSRTEHGIAGCSIFSVPFFHPHKSATTKKPQIIAFWRQIVNFWSLCRGRLVLCPRNNFTKSAQFFEYGIRCSCPDKGLGMLII